MKQIITYTGILLGVLAIVGCSNSPKPIDYGNDGCHYCRMTIVDKIHGAELITDKGKIFKFDATECMLNYMAENEALQISSLLINYYEAPSEFIVAEEATFLISENLPSPMGANLTAFQEQASAERVQLEKGGKLYTWESLKPHLGN